MSSFFYPFFTPTNPARNSNFFVNFVTDFHIMLKLSGAGFPKIQKSSKQYIFGRVLNSINIIVYSLVYYSLCKPGSLRIKKSDLDKNEYFTGSRSTNTRSGLVLKDEKKSTTAQCGI
jgi:hypothetical protein